MEPVTAQSAREVVHYISHQAVVREHTETTKMRINGVVSKETVVLRRSGVVHRNLDLSTELVI